MKISFDSKFSTFNELNSTLDKKLNIDLMSRKELIDQFSLMFQIRIIEQVLAEKRKSGSIGGPVHLSAGQEAIAVGISKFLRKTDFVLSGHRSHAHLLALGSDPYKLFAEVLGKSTGLTKGMGGSMHLWDGPNGFYGSVPIVAGSVPLAVGAALALKMQNRDITTLSETDKIALYTYYSEEFIQCFTPFEIPTNPSCCNLDHRNRRGRCNEIIDATPR